MACELAEKVVFLIIGLLQDSCRTCSRIFKVTFDFFNMQLDSVGHLLCFCFHFEITAVAQVQGVTVETDT